MIPLRKFLATVSAFAVLVTACSSSPELIATVAGEVEITTDDIAALYESKSIPADSTLRGAIYALAAREVIKAALSSEFGITIDQAQVDQLYLDMTLDRDARGQTTADWLGVPDAGDGLMVFNAEIAVLRDQTIRALAAQPEYLDELFADPTAITEVCARHILVATETEAQDVYVQLLAGADFAALADELSTDTGEGGDLGCRPAAVYVDEFAAAAMEAPIGEVFGPVQSQFGWHVLLVSERTTPTREEVAADPITHLASGEADRIWEEWVSAALSAADVVVEAKYGSWTSTGIVPPIE
ncbi:MAG TPA: peptidylprolyl isomerase [Acidimicrobiia bacterium]|nr:peptidylprolyl isomerase [Acidimicrobiia bacterium]